MSGFLAGASERAGTDFRRAECFVGTSAGSIVAARLAAGAPPGRAGASSAAAPAPPTSSVRTARERLGRVSPKTVMPVASVALSAAAPAGALVRAALLAAVPQGRMPLESLRGRIASIRSRFDGRLRVVAVDMRTGRRVVFGAPGAPPAEVAEAVMASCAVPGLFRPIRIGERDYVDGGVWSPTNLDVAPLRPGVRVLCLVPTAALEAAPQSLFRVLVRGWKIATALEAGAARSRGAQVTIIEPDPRAAAAMAADLMDPRPRERVHAAGFAQGLHCAKATAGSASR